MAGPPKKLSERKGLQVSLPKEHYDYLELLGTMGRLGNTVPTVAEHILVRELDAMMRADYHDKKFKR